MKRLILLVPIIRLVKNQGFHRIGLGEGKSGFSQTRVLLGVEVVQAVIGQLVLLKMGVPIRLKNWPVLF